MSVHELILHLCRTGTHEKSAPRTPRFTIKNIMAAWRQFIPTFKEICLLYGVGPFAHHNLGMPFFFWSSFKAWFNFSTWCFVWSLYFMLISSIFNLFDPPLGSTLFYIIFNLNDKIQYFYLSNACNFVTNLSLRFQNFYKLTGSYTNLNIKLHFIWWPWL